MIATKFTNVIERICAATEPTAMFFAGYNNFAGGDTLGISTDSIWQDVTSPDGNISLMSSRAGAGGYGTFLDDVKNKIHHVIPDTNVVLNSLAQLRAVRTDPPMDRVAGVTDIKFFRCISRTIEGNIPVHFAALSGSVGISSNSWVKNGDMLVYPNPANEIVNFNFTSTEFETAAIEINDLTGRLVDKIQINRNSIVHYDTKNLEQSIYTVTLRANNKMVSAKKLVIIK